MGMADVGAQASRALAVRCLGARDQPTGGGNRLDLGEAVEVIDVVEPHATEHLAHAGDGWQPIEGVGVLRVGGVDEGEFSVTKQIIIVTDACQIDFHTLLHRGLGTALSHPVTVGLIGNLLTTGRQVIRAVGIVHVGQPLGSCMGQRQTASQQGAGRPPLGRLDRGVWEQAAPAQDGHLVRVDRVVCGLTPRDRLHVQGLAEDERDAFMSTQVGQPGPR
jgi:hypothetical protein